MLRPRSMIRLPTAVGLTERWAAVEELHPGLHLGSLDAAAEGRLRQVRTLGSATEVQFLGKKQHVLQMANVHDAENA